jgi:hypothetical protein
MWLAVRQHGGYPAIPALGAKPYLEGMLNSTVEF